MKRRSAVVLAAVSVLVSILTIPALGQATLSLDPASGLAGSQVTATVTNATPGHEFAIFWDGTASADEVADGFVGGDGTAVASFEVPAIATPGAYTVTFCSLTGGGGACPQGPNTATFQVVTPPPTTSPAPPPTTSPPQTTTTTTTTIPAAPPVAVDDSATTEAGTSIFIPVLTNDTAGSGLDLASLDISLQPARGVAIPQGDGTILYQPEPGYVGIDRFSYEVCDTGQVCVMATVTVEITSCPVDEHLVESFRVEPDAGLGGDVMNLVLQINPERVEGCFSTSPSVRFSFEDMLLAGPVFVDASGSVEVESEVPTDVDEGDYSIVAQLGEPPQPIADVAFTIGASDDGLPQWVIWTVIALVSLIAGTLIGRQLSRGGDHTKPDPDATVVPPTEPNAPDTGTVNGPVGE